MYAEVPGKEVDKFSADLVEGSIYEFSRFLVVNSKATYKPFESKFMVRFTPWTKIQKLDKVDHHFPRHVFYLVPFSEVGTRAGVHTCFTG